MTPDDDARYEASLSRDPRFDGVFFLGVTSTGIYCRTVCPARKPSRKNSRFFDNAESAEAAGFRPCLRCRPELAPGHAPIDEPEQVAALLAHRIADGALDRGGGLEDLARRFGWSSRHLRRLVHDTFGVSPMTLVLTRRLLLAKQLLSGTSLPMGQIAFAAGFGSVRRFNDAFVSRYGMSPGRLRAAGRTGRGKGASCCPPTAGYPTPAEPLSTDMLTLRLGWRPPFAWHELIRFLGGRGLRGVEHADATSWRRTARAGNATGIIVVTNDEARRELRVAITPALAPALGTILARVRHLFDLHARPDLIAERLGRDPLIAPLIAEVPGLRIPGGYDGFEIALRAIVGQQVSVKGATAVAARLVTGFGEPFDSGDPSLTHLAPTAGRLAGVDPEQLSRAIGVPQARGRTIITLARAVSSGAISLEPGAPPAETIARLVALPGIGPWTANYIALRALRWPDAFLAGDLVLRREMGGVTERAALAMAERWRPWRGYAAIHIWRKVSAGG